MNKTIYFEAYKQFCVRFNYKKRSFIRYCTVPMRWEFKDVENYLHLLFDKAPLKDLNYHQKSVFLYNKKEAIIKIDDGYNVDDFWRDGIELEIELLFGKKTSIVTVVTASTISESQIFEKLKNHYPLAKDMSIFYQTECWIKNDNYIENV